MKSKEKNIETIASFCKRKGLVFNAFEIYGGSAGFFDYGPLGVELKNKIKASWWKFFVQKRLDIFGIDASLVNPAIVWRASGHEEKFTDPMLVCSKCGFFVRADHFIEEKLNINADDLTFEQLKEIVNTNNLECPKCKSPLKDLREFNLMFKTYNGPIEGKANLAYLRPETAQLIFINFKNVLDTSRAKLPFGIAQIGRAFRNEISPRNFLFRCKEFEMMEIEYFVKDYDSCPFFDEIKDYELHLLPNTSKERESFVRIKAKDAVEKGILDQWLAYWIAKSLQWLTSLGLDKNLLRARQQFENEKAHYSKDTWDIEYKFPFGWKEIEGIAERTDYDLKRHEQYSKKDLKYFDQGTGNKFLPFVIEPSFGLDRIFLALIFNAYEYDEERQNVVLKLSPKLAPWQVAVFPLLSNRQELISKAKEIFSLLSEHFVTFFDVAGSIGKRYARQDEVGTPYCITIDFQTLEDETVTIRFRDSKRQERIAIKELREKLNEFLEKEVCK